MTDTPYPPLPPETWPPALADLREGFAGRLNVYRTMAHHPDLLRAWVPLRAHVVQDNALGAERLEVAILRIAHRLDAAYEWTHHVQRAQAVGLTAERIDGMRGDPARMAPEDATLARAVDAALDGARLPPDVLEPLRAAVGDAGVFDLIATVGFYLTLGCLLKTAGTPLEDDVPPA